MESGRCSCRACSPLASTAAWPRFCA